MQFLPDWVKENFLDKSLVTKQAKQNMIDAHSEKYLAAWINKKEFVEKIVSLEDEFESLPDEAKEKAEQFIKSHKADQHAKLPQDADVQRALSIKNALDSLQSSYKTACHEFDGYASIIKQIKQV